MGSGRGWLYSEADVISREAASPVLSAHRRTPFGLNHLQQEGARAARDARLLPRQQRAGREVAYALDRPCAADVQATPVESGPGTRPRLQCTHLTIDRHRIAPPLDPPIGPGEGADHGCGPLILWRCNERAFGPRPQEWRDHLGGQVRQPRLEVRRLLPAG